MCGIAGCIAQRGQPDKEKFEKMTDVIAHRGPDDRGTYYEGTLAFGHRRLSIIDLSSDGHQPFKYAERYVLVYNGEIYNYLELREELKLNGYTFKTQTDTEVLAAAYDYWREDCVNRFNGMWAFSIYDRKEQTVFCSRDRFGVKPFYYTEQEGMFLFASEIKQFFEMLHGKPKANKACLLQYIIRGSIDYSDETMFSGVYQLRPGHNLIYNLKSHEYRIYRYHDIRQIAESDIPYKEACKEFRRRFTDSVRLRLRADVPVGYCLSGGLDSSSIVCTADKLYSEKIKRSAEGAEKFRGNLSEKQAGQPRYEQESIQAGQPPEQHTISSCFEDKRYDEQEYIDEVVRHTSVIPHKVFPRETRLFEQLDDIIWHMDEPFGSTSIYAQWNVFEEAARQRLKVMLDGQGADEQLAGYSSFYRVLFTALLKKGKLKEFKREWNAYKTIRAATEKYLSITDTLLSSLSSVFINDDKKSLLKLLYYKLPGKTLPFSDKQLKKALKDETAYSMGNAREYIATSMYGSMAALLHYEDRDSMAHSIESRVPFLDVELAEFIYSLPLEYKIHKGITKAVLRDSLTGILPEKIKNRYSKLGFVTPEDQWINNNYDKYAAELKKAAHRLNGLLDEKRVVRWFEKKTGKSQKSGLYDMENHLRGTLGGCV